MELQPRMQRINHAQAKSGIPEEIMGILHGETSHAWSIKYSFITNQISRMNKENL